MPDFIYELPLLPMFMALQALTGLLAAAMFALPHVVGLRRLVGRAGTAAPVLQGMIGTFFVLSTSFLSNAVWQTEDRAAASIAAEARGLRIVRTYAENMAAPAEAAFLKMVEDYALAVRDIEWSEMASRGAAPEAEDSLRQLYRGAIAGLGEGEAGRILRQPVLGALDDISQARESRLETARQLVSPIQWTVVLVLAFILLLTVAVCHHHDAIGRAFALAVVSAAVATCLFALLAHDRPFVGALSLTPAPIVQAAGL